MTRHVTLSCPWLRRALGAAACGLASVAAAQTPAPPAASGPPASGPAATPAANGAASAPAGAASAPTAPPLVVPPAISPTASPGLASTVYGILDVAAGRFQEPGQTRLLGMEGGAMQLSFLGIRGGDDLGGGLKARFGLETYVRVNQGTSGRATATDPYWGRTAYVGFQGQFGTSLAGRLPTPLYALTRQFNPFDESYGFSPAIRQWYGGVILGDARWSNSLAYSSPDPEDGNGWSWKVQYNAQDKTTGSNSHNVGASLNYTSGPLMAGAAWQRVGNGLEVVPAAFDHQTAYQIGMSYELRALRLYGQIGHVKTSAASAERTDLYQLGVAVPVSLGFALVSYGHARTETDLFSSLRRTFSIGYDYFLSRNTDVYALAMNERVTNLSSANSLAAGVRLRF